MKLVVDVSFLTFYLFTLKLVFAENNLR